MVIKWDQTGLRLVRAPEFVLQFQHAWSDRPTFKPCHSTDESDSLLDHEPSVWFQQDEDFMWHIKSRDISEMFNWNIHVRLIPLFELGWWKYSFHVGHRRLPQNNQLWPAISSAALNMDHILYKTPCVSNNTCSLYLSCGRGGQHKSFVL